MSISLKGSMPLVDNGKPVARIYVAEHPKQVVEPDPFLGDKTEDKLEVAIEELNYHLERMSGAKLEVVRSDDPKIVHGNAIVLGDLAEKLGASLQPTPYADSYRLLARNGALLIAGETRDATLNGVYDLLGRLGCDWVMPGKIGEVIPSKPTLEAPDLDEIGKPDFYHRNLWYSGGNKGREKEFEEFRIWKRRQRMGQGVGIVGLGSGHVWGALIQRHKAEFDRDPTMYALVRNPDGTLERKGPQLEPTHPRVIELFAEEIREAFAKNKWPKDKAVAFGIGPSDGGGFSESAEAQLAGSGKIDPITGQVDQTDSIVLLGNKILEKIHGEYPNVRLGFYSYSIHSDYPARYKPAPQINPIFAPITFSRYQSLEDKNSKTLPYYRSVLEKWGKLSDEQGNIMAFRGYNWALAEGMAPYSQLRILGENIPFYYRLHIRAVSIEDVKEWAVTGPHDYLLAQLLWNSHQDWKAILHQYCVRSFGAGAPFMEAYFLRITLRQHQAGQEAGSFYPLPLMYDDAFVAQGEKDLNDAEAAARAKDEKVRIGYFRYPLRALKLYLALDRAIAHLRFDEAKKIYDQMENDWKEAHQLNSQIVSKVVPNYLGRFLKDFVEEGLKYSSAPYQVVFQVPDRLPTLLDPTSAGAQLKYQSPEINDSSFIETSTWASTWDAQGLGALRSGAVWYRVRFTAPAKREGEKIGLFLGAVDDEARVWINGKWAGTSGIAFSLPCTFDLSDGIQYGKENVLAIMVVHNNGNELGIGGILRPGFIFSGPPLPEKAANAGERRRILPGGAEAPSGK